VSRMGWLRLVISNGEVMSGILRHVETPSHDDQGHHQLHIYLSRMNESCHISIRHVTNKLHPVTYQRAMSHINES